MIRPVNPAGMAPPFARYSHGVVFPGASEVLVTSGQLALGPDGNVPEDAEAQCVLIFEALGAILHEAGFTWPGVVRFGAYTTNRAHFPVIDAVRARYAPGGAFASTLLIVSGFTRPEFKVEVELTAIRA